MTNEPHYEIKIHLKDISESEQAIALLENYPFNGYHEDDEILLAYIPEREFTNDIWESIKTYETTYQWQISKTIVAPQNWNAVWESDYKPIEIDNFCRIRAKFHPASPDFKHEILINPEMSFGTGHHATTHMMIQAMQELNFQGKDVLDHGCGTGILAILAHKMGAKNIDAIDIDPWAYKNTVENCKNNDAENIHVWEGELTPILGHKFYNIILANINRHVLLLTIPSMLKQLQEEGTLILSGILTDQDISIIKKQA